MIYKLRKKFIVISAVSITTVFSLIFLVIYFIGTSQLNSAMDTLADVIAYNNGTFPEYDSLSIVMPSDKTPMINIITSETRFSTRFFTVWTDRENYIIQENVDSISSVSRTQARQYAMSVIKKGKNSGWISDYRYRVYDTGFGSLMVFVNGGTNRTMTHMLLWTALFVLVGSGLIVLLLIVIFSKKAVQPAAESYEKQKQFITDANHELKTPLTLILSNLDIIEAEIGKNEWVDDIRSEGERMSLLVNQLVALSRMDEDKTNIVVSEFDLSSAVSDTVSDFMTLAKERQKELDTSIEADIHYTGDEGLIRRIVSILLDNAVKYCDQNGQIRVTLQKKRHPVLTVENTYAMVNQVELDRLFDRFYRADKARTFSGSFGVGLSIAKAIARQHHGDITAYKKDDTHIGFRVVLK